MSTAAQKRMHARALRDCAARAATAARSLHGLLDGACSSAGDDKLWAGTFADRSTTALRAWRSTTQGAADELVTAAAHWKAVAAQLEHEAGTQAEAG